MRRGFSTRRFGSRWRGSDAYAPALASLLLVGGMAFAQPMPAFESPPVGFKIGFVPQDEDRDVEVRGVSFGLLGDAARRVRGLQFASFYARTYGDLSGGQIAVGFNFVDGAVDGFQLALGFNFANQGRGLQLAAVNVARTWRGLQLGFSNGTDDGIGVQLGVANGAERFAGLRIGLFNGGEEVRGATIGLVNFGWEHRGFEIGLLNVPCVPFPFGECDKAGRETRGISVGLVNVADTAVGFQMGVVNVIRKAQGFQLGIINVAMENQGESFALLNLNGNGIHTVALYASDILWTNLALKLGARRLYTSISAGYQPGDELAPGPARFVRGSRRYGLGLGAGWVTPVAVGRIEAIEIEAGGMALRSAFAPGWSIYPLVASLRAQVAIRVFRHLALIAGVAANVVVATDGRDADIGFPGTLSRWGDNTARVFPGFVIGVQMP